MRALPEREERVEVDAVRAVRLARQEIAPARHARALADASPFSGVDDAVDDERAVERKAVARTANDGEVVRTHGVVNRPAEEQGSDRGDAERRERPERGPPRAGTQQERAGRARSEHLADRPNEDEERQTPSPTAAARPDVRDSTSRAVSSAASANAAAKSASLASRWNRST